MKRNIVAIDIGTSKICTLICRYDPDTDDLETAGKGIWPSRGIRKGMIVNTEECSAALRNSVAMAQDDAGAVIGSAYVNIIGMNVCVIDKKDELKIDRGDAIVLKSDILELLTAAKKVGVCQDEQVIDVIPRTYYADGARIYGNPEGAKAKTLAMESQVMVARIAPLQRIIRCMSDIGLEIDGFIVEALALPELVLTEEERRSGAVIIDVGGAITDVSLFRNGRLYFNDSIPVGGYHLANDLSIGLNIPYGEAEEFIRSQRIPANSAPEGGDAEPSGSAVLGEASEIIEARVSEIFSLCAAMIRKNNFNPPDDASLLLLSGKGIMGIATVPECAGKYFGLPVRFVSDMKDAPFDIETVTAYSMARYVPLKYRWDNFSSKVEGALYTEIEKQPGILQSIKRIAKKMFGF